MSRAGIGNRKADLHAKMRSKRKPPRGMYLNQECLMSVATGPPGQGDTILKQYEVELVELKRQVGCLSCNPDTGNPFILSVWLKEKLSI